MSKYNVIYVVAHDLGQELGVYGSGFKTPNLDAFGREGVVFTQACCASPACSPSRGCVMTGMTAHSNGLVGLANPGAIWSLPQETKTIVDDFNDEGYDTVHAGMQHERLKGRSNRYQKELDTGGWVEDAVDGAINYLKQRQPGDRPFYLNLGTNEVHSGQWETYKIDRKHNKRERYGEVPPDEVEMPDYLPDFPQLRKEWGAFQGCVQFWDRHVGRLLDAVKALGYEDDTIVVVTTDHGVAAERSKSTLYKEGVGIALLMNAPGSPMNGSRVDHLISNLDLLPTLLDACGIPVRAEVEGRSFWPLLAGEEYVPNDRIMLERNFHDNFDPMRGIRTEDFALIWNFDPDRKRQWLPGEVTHMKDSYQRWFTELWMERQESRPEFELFDRKKDPAERNNVADRGEYREVLENLKGRIEDWMHETSDPLLEAKNEDGFKRVMQERFPELQELSASE